MELFTKDKAVKLRSHHDKYLVADDDQETVRQSRNGSSMRAVWTVEMVPRKPNLIRLKSCHGKYLTAGETSFLLGMTGEKVIQAAPYRQAEYESEWEPIRDGFPVKLMSWSNKFLRANGGTPPWRNSVTHDHEPYTPATKKWILWFVEDVKDQETLSFGDRLSPLSSFDSSISADYGNGSDPASPASASSSKNKKFSSLDSSVSTGSNPGSPASVPSVKSARFPFTPPMSPRFAPRTKQGTNSNRIEISAIEFFHNAKTVRLRNVHNKYLTAEDDEETVTQGRNGSSKNARWSIEPVPGSSQHIRLKSCHGKYLTASNKRFLLGATGYKVVQSKPSLLDSSVEWEPVKEGSKVKLKSCYGGQFLRANGGVPPWRNSVTYDTPNRTVTQDWVLWDVDVVEILVHSKGEKS